MLRKFEKNLAERGIRLTIDSDALDYLLSQGYDSEYGARPLRRVIEQYVEDAVAEGLISGRIRDNSAVYVKLVNGQIVVE